MDVNKVSDVDYWIQVDSVRVIIILYAIVLLLRFCNNIVNASVVLGVYNMFPMRL